MASLRDKLKVKTNLAKEVERDENGGSNRDPRYLNYYDLKYDEKMKVIFIPDVNNSVWHSYRAHSAPKGVFGVETIGCPGASSCPICQRGFELNAAGKENDDQSLKDEAKKWFGDNKKMASVLVIQSPCDINQSEDGNEVKLFNMPYGIQKVINEAIKEGFVDEDTISLTPFIIKKTKNQGGQAAYDSSYFAREQLTDEDLDDLDELQIDPYDFSSLDVIPDPVSDDEAEAWIELLESKLAAKSTEKPKNTKSAVGDRLAGKNKNNRDDENDQTGNDQTVNDQKEESSTDDKKGDAEDKKDTSTGKSIRDRLRNAR